MTSTISIRGKQSRTTNLSAVLSQRIVADSGQSNHLRMDTALGSHMNFTDGQSNSVQLKFAQGNWIDLGDTQSNRVVVSRGEENVIDMRDSQSDTLVLRSGEGNIVNLVDTQSDRITLGSGRVIRTYRCGEGNHLTLLTAPGDPAEDVQCLRYGSYRLMRFRNNFLIQEPRDATQRNSFGSTGCNNFTYFSTGGSFPSGFFQRGSFPSGSFQSGSIIVNEDKDDFKDAPKAMTLDDAKLLPTRRLYSTVALKKRQCGICRCDFSEGNVLRVLPCLHEFHMQCIDEFLSGNRVCPECRQVVYG